MFYHWKGNDLVLNIYLQTGASLYKILGIYQDYLKICVKARPIKGQANRDLIKFLAKKFNLSVSKVILLKGKKSKKKQILIKSPNVNDLPIEIKK